MEKFLRLLKTTLEVILVIVFIFFEELIWKKLALPVKNYISGLKILESTKEKIMIQSAYMTLLIFLIPLAIAEAMGIYSGILFVSGSIIGGAFLYALKIPIAGLTFWIFSFTKEKLLTIDWFETLYELLMRFLNFIKETDIYKSVKLKIVDIKARIKHSMPGQGGFSEEINHVYSGLKHIFKGAKAIDKDDIVETVDKEDIVEDKETDDKNKAHQEYAKEQKMKKEEDIDVVGSIEEANKHIEIKPANSRRDKMEEPKKEDVPENESRGSAKR